MNVLGMIGVSSLALPGILLLLGMLTVVGIASLLFNWRLGSNSATSTRNPWSFNRLLIIFLFAFGVLEMLVFVFYVLSGSFYVPLLFSPVIH